MSSKTKRISAFGLLLAALVVVGGLYLFPTARVRADDSTHSTSLSVGAGVAQASLSDTATSDDTWVISFYRTQSGQSAQLIMEFEGSKSSGWQAPNASARLTTSGYTSGDLITARYRTYDSGGTNTFDYSRSGAIP